MIDYQEGVRLRAARAEKAGRRYRPLHTPEQYLEFIRSQLVHFLTRQLHPQADAPEAYGLFTLVSQHVRGDCLEELLDNAMHPWECKRLASFLDELPRKGAQVDNPEGVSWIEIPAVDALAINRVLHGLMFTGIVPGTIVGVVTMSDTQARQAAAQLRKAAA